MSDYRPDAQEITHEVHSAVDSEQLALKLGRLATNLHADLAEITDEQQRTQLILDAFTEVVHYSNAAQ